VRDSLDSVIRAARSAAVLLAVMAVAAGCGGSDDEASGGGSGTPAQRSASPDGADPQAAPALGYPGFATSNTTRIGGADPIADAAAVATAVFPARSTDTQPNAVTVVDDTDWRVAISAAQLMAAPLRSPILFTQGRALPAATAQALATLRPVGAKEAHGAQVIRIGDTPRIGGYRTAEVRGADHASLAQAVDRLSMEAAGDPSPAVVVASSEQPGYAMPAAGWAAKSGTPVLWVTRAGIPAATRAAIQAHGKPQIYVLGPETAVSDDVVRGLTELGTVQRIGDRDPVANAIDFARFSDGSFGWNVVDPGHGIVFASTQRPQDAAAAAALSATGSYGPLLLLTEPNVLPPAVQDFLLDIQPGYDTDPVRGVYNHGWMIGDQSAITVDVQARIDSLLEIVPVDTSSGS
jgi:hypothetical protein